MVIKLGYDNCDSENKLYASIKTMYYAELISKLLNEKKRINRPLDIQLSKTTTAQGLKYDCAIKNFFFFRLSKYIFTFDFDVFQKTKMNKLVNFNMSPGIKLTLSNNKLPFDFSYKYYSIQPSRDQLFDGNDYSRILNSLLPYKVNVLSFSHNSAQDFQLFNFNQLFFYKLKFSFGKISNFHDFLKMTLGYKVVLKLPTYTDLFGLSLHSENFLKKSLSFESKKSYNATNSGESSNTENNKHTYNYTHIISNFDCRSKLLGIDLFAKEGVIDNGCNFYIQSSNSLRLENIKIFKDIDILNRIEPYFGIEGIYFPNKSFKNIREIINNVSLIYSLGFSLKIQEYMYLDFIFKTWSNNDSFDENKINKFRLNIEFSTIL